MKNDIFIADKLFCITRSNWRLMLLYLALFSISYPMTLFIGIFPYIFVILSCFAISTWIFNANYKFVQSNVDIIIFSMIGSSIVFMWLNVLYVCSGISNSANIFTMTILILWALKKVFIERQNNHLLCCALIFSSALAMCAYGLFLFAALTTTLFLSLTFIVARIDLLQKMSRWISLYFLTFSLLFAMREIGFEIAQNVNHPNRFGFFIVNSSIDLLRLIPDNASNALILRIGASYPIVILFFISASFFVHNAINIWIAYRIYLGSNNANILNCTSDTISWMFFAILIMIFSSYFTVVCGSTYILMPWTSCYSNFCGLILFSCLSGLASRDKNQSGASNVDCKNKNNIYCWSRHSRC